jgi:hypothetical protein
VNRWRRWLFSLVAGCLVTVSVTQAHLIVSQRGTLNIVDGGAYMVLSLPISAFIGIDDDGDGRLSLDELRIHARSIETQIQGGAQLVSNQGAHVLEGLMLNTSPPDNAPGAPASQIVAMGRFPLDSQASKLAFSLNLFGRGTGEQIEQITVTRGPETQLMSLTPQNNRGEVFPSSCTIFVDQVVNGATHVLAGADHLLFLLVVLATGWGLRYIVLALTCFTVGHAITLVASAWFGWVVSANIVEPAIAATILGMALFDRWLARRRVKPSATIRFALIFGCALIHGLGLAGAFSDLGLSSNNKLLSLAGFNTGIEIGQLTVALGGAAVVKAIYYLRGSMAVAAVMRFTCHAAVLIGSFWFVERIVFTA